MGNKVENVAGLKALDAWQQRYLFFGDELHVGIDAEENHTDILKGSGRTADQVRVAGVLAAQTYVIYVVGGGSSGLKIEERDPSSVVDFINQFPDIGTIQVVSS